MLKKHLLSLLIIVYLFNSCKELPPNSSNIDALGGIELTSDFDYLPTSTSDVVISHPQYSFSYIEKYEQSEWVAYHLTSKDINSANYDRPYFNQDKKVKTKSADWRNFKNSGYNKGHLCPAADRKATFEDYEATFLTSNASPQLYDFNAGIWNRLEQKVRYWAERYNGIYVITGGVLTDGLKAIGSEDVAVPDYFYKIILTEDGKNMIGFLMPHEKSDKPLYSYVVPVDSIEKATGIDFFPNLEDDLENNLEKEKGYSNWKF